MGGAAARGVPALFAGDGTCRGGGEPAPASPEGQTGKGELSSLLRRRIVCSCGARWNRFGAPTPRAALENVAMVEKPVEHRADRGGITQQLSPVVHGTI